MPWWIWPTCWVSSTTWRARAASQKAIDSGTLTPRWTWLPLLRKQGDLDGTRTVYDHGACGSSPDPASASSMRRRAVCSESVRHLA